ncbi:hypothetical protein IGI04_022627, partial [Brassica rapa subsp. trilocularis]
SENVVANIKLRRARHQTIRYNTTDDDPPLTHVVPPISQPNIRFRNVILLSPPHFLQRTHKEETARLPSSCVLSRDELHRRSRDEVSVPSVICSSVDWDNKKTKKRNKKKRKEATRRVRLGDKLLLRVRGAPLALIHVSSSDPLPHLSIKNTPIETSSAQFIRQRYTAASSGQKLQNSITNAYGEAQDDHF